MSNSTVIGTTSSFYGVATFQSQPIITSTILANNDNSTNIATTAWANSFLTYAQTQPNTWTGEQTFTTANVSVLNVFKTSVDTINASSITSDMTIGANLNGGSLTIGGTSINIGKVNSVTNFSSGTINASNFKLYSTIDVYNQSAWLDTIGTTITPQLVLGYNNASQVYLGSPNTPLIFIGGDKGTVKIANDGLVAGARVNIATGTNNVGNSQVTIGSSTLSTVLLNGVNVVMNDQTGSKVQIGGKDMGVMYLRAATLYINDGNSDYINNGNTIIGNNWGSGNITINKPLTVGYLPTFTSSSQIGWNNFQDSGIVPIVYYGGNRTWLWWGESGVSPLYPGIYMVCYTSYTNTTTNYTQSFIYKTLTKPIYGLDVIGFASVNESNFEFPSGYTGGFKLCGSGIINIPSYNYYLGICQNVFATGSPSSSIYCAANIIRIA